MLALKFYICSSPHGIRFPLREETCILGFHPDSCWRAGTCCTPCGLLYPGSETNPVPAGEGSAEPWVPAPLCLRLPLPNTCPLPLSCLIYLSLFSALNLAVAPPEGARLRPCLLRGQGRACCSPRSPPARQPAPGRGSLGLLAASARTSPPCLGYGPRCSAGGGPCFPHRPPSGPAI